METRSLELFLDLSRTLRFRSTSRRCHLTPSALSRAIGRLEQEVGERLFERDRRTVKMTPAGVRFREYAERAWSDWQAYRAAAREELRGSLSIYCSVTACYAILPPILTRFRGHHPHVSVFLRTGDAESAMRRVSDGETDVALVLMPERPPRHLAFTRVLEAPLIFVAPEMDCAVARAVSRGRINWGALPLVLPESGSARAEVERWFRGRGLRPNVYAYVSGSEAIMSMVSLGFGVGVVPAMVAEHRPAVIRLRYLDKAPALRPYVGALCARKRSLENPIVRAMFESVSAQ